MRVLFLNEFYQYLVPYRMAKVSRKLVVVGARSSGVDSWAALLSHFIAARKIAPVVDSGRFSTSVVRPDTQLVVIRDWSRKTMEVGYMVELFRGGLVTVPRRCKAEGETFVLNIARSSSLRTGYQPLVKIQPLSTGTSRSFRSPTAGPNLNGRPILDGGWNRTTSRPHSPAERWYKGWIHQVKLLTC